MIFNNYPNLTVGRPKKYRLTHPLSFIIRSAWMYFWILVFLIRLNWHEQRQSIYGEATAWFNIPIR